MNIHSIIRKNSAYYRDYHRLMVVATVIAVTVIVGSLLIGDSVRGTLVRKVTERLGNTETLIFANSGFIKREFVDDPVFDKKATGVLLSNGFVVRNGALIPVMVWGVEEHGIAVGSGKINEKLATELSLTAEEDIVLRLPATGMVPTGSLFVTDNYTTSMRLRMGGILPIDSGGNRYLSNEQTTPLNIFVNQTELAQIMGVEGEINLILSEKPITTEVLERAWRPEMSGLNIRKKGEMAEIVTPRIFIPETAVECLTTVNRRAVPLFSYLVNDIATPDSTIPYSFVTAIDEYQGEKIAPDEIIVSDYTAKRLLLTLGDRIKLRFYTAKDLKRLQTDSLELVVKAILPIETLHSDSTLSAQFPGLSNVNHCTDWNSDLPINMKRITKEDEAYWDQYKTTPKALISYKAVKEQWSMAYGNATAIRVDATTATLEGVTAAMMGVQVVQPRENALKAARSGIDFSSLFLSLGFFIIVAAGLLFVQPVAQLLLVRKGEIETMRALGFRDNVLLRLYLRELIGKITLGVGIGIIGALVYTQSVLFLLGTLWKGATHADSFTLYATFPSVAGGVIASLSLILLLLYCTIKRGLRSRVVIAHHRILTSWRLTLFTFPWVVLGCVASFIVLPRMIGFILCGVLLMSFFVILGYNILHYRSKVGGLISIKLLPKYALVADLRGNLTSFLTLTLGIFTVLMVGLNKQDFGNSEAMKSGTGGYSFWTESVVPVYHDLSTTDGRTKLNLKALPKGVTIEQLLRLKADDASCLNLNKPQQPTVLGIPSEALREGDFKFSETIDQMNKEEVIALMKQQSNGTIPVVVDATVLQWSLFKTVGDTLLYTDAMGNHLVMKIVGALENSIFQGTLLVDRSLFTTIWNGISGSEVMLVKCEEQQQKEVKQLLERALYNYGINVQSTNERLADFYSVTDTYLLIFMTLGALGLLVGIIALMVSIRKKLILRETELQLYRSLGFSQNRVESLLLRELLLVPLYALIAGSISAYVGVGLGWGSSLIAVIGVVLVVALIGSYIRITVKRTVSESFLRS